jgi:hypothetical protein
MTTFSHLWQYLAEFFWEWEMFQVKVIVKIKTHILCSITFFRKACRLWDNVEKYGRAWEVTNDNMAHARCMLDKQGYARARTFTPPRNTRSHTHTQKCIIGILTVFPQQQWFASAPNYYVIRTRWFKYDRDDLCVNKSQFVPVIFEPPCTLTVLLLSHSKSVRSKRFCWQTLLCDIKRGMWNTESLIYVTDTQI